MSHTIESTRRLPIGAEVVATDTVDFCLWAPRRKRVRVVFEAGTSAVDLKPESDGYFAGRATARPGARYRFLLDDDATPYPDPASRFQPHGPHGPSEVVNPATFSWTDAAWPGVPVSGQVIYELHIGTFTTEGTWTAAAEKLPLLRDVGVTVVEVMPVADFPGTFGWGYDGVNLFAPTRLYGRPDEFRAFVNRAHALGLGVILDVVYNHIGPDGNYLGQFSPGYFTDRYKTDWGAAINYDGPDAGPVREFFITNAAHWIAEYHLDGLRLDATQTIFDASPRHILTDIGAAARQAAGRRSIIIVNENESQHARLVRPVEDGGYGLDMLWNDDFHHSAKVALTGRREAYYTDYLGMPQEFVSAAKYGYLYQGQWYKWQKQRRGMSTFDIPPTAFVTFIENHDQVANSARGLRCHALASPGRLRAMTGLLLLGPGTPMLFQGQEFAATSPFLFFADHNQDLANLVRKGRAEFLSQFPSTAQPSMFAQLPDPSNPSTFEKCKIRWAERGQNQAILEMHRDLLLLRRTDPAFSAPRIGGVDGAVLGAQAFILRFFGEQRGGPDDRLLIVNFGPDLRLNPAPEPLLAPPSEGRWELKWTSEDPKYGGSGTPPLDTESDNWHVPGQTSVVLKSAERRLPRTDGKLVRDDNKL
jgi:maltooligosyltrehalose trehalohydrolase